MHFLARVIAQQRNANLSGGNPTREGGKVFLGTGGFSKQCIGDRLTSLRRSQRTHASDLRAVWGRYVHDDLPHLCRRFLTCDTALNRLGERADPARFLMHVGAQFE